MKHLKFIPLAAVLAALSACHNNGAGVDSGASQKAATSSENGLKSDRSIRSSTSGAATIQMPAAPLMIEALIPLARSAYLPAESAASSAASAANGPMAGIDIRAMLWRGVLEAPLAEDDMSPKTLHMFALIPLAATAYPVPGWPPFGCFGCEKQVNWARGMAREVVYSNLVLTELYPAIGAQALADPAAAKAAVQAAWKKLPPQTILSAWQQAGEQVKGGEINFDFTGHGPAPVHFMIGNNDFQGGPNGWKWSQNGVVWFGDGRLSGQARELSLQNAIDKSTSQVSSSGTSSGTSTEQAAGGSAGVK
jgi:hypothetical protein